MNFDAVGLTHSPEKAGVFMLSLKCLCGMWQ
jgi:hypothetical protein